MNIQKQRIGKKRQQILAILSGRTLYEKPVLTESIFNTDLVLKIKLPLGEESLMIDKTKHVSLDEFVYNPDQHLVYAHQTAYEKLLQEVDLGKRLNINEQKNDKSIRVRNQVNFTPLLDDQSIDKRYQAQLENGQKQTVVFPCYIKCSSTIMDCFTLNYNTLIYVLQKKCGFQTTSYFVQESTKDGQADAYIYILLTQDTDNLLKSADRFKIKKEIDYCQLDLFLNQPVDQLQRPYQGNPVLGSIQKDVIERIKIIKKEENEKIKTFQQPLNRNQIILKIDKKDNKKGTILSSLRRKPSIQNNNLNYDPIKLREQQERDKQFQQLNTIKQMFKRVHRNMNDKLYKINDAINQQEKLKDKTKTKLTNYLSNFFVQFDQILQEDYELTNEQKNYILDINRGKINPKCEKEYILKMKRKKVFELLKRMSKQYGFKTYTPPIAYFPFILPSKQASFMQRFNGLLLYEEYCTNPYGQYSLFSKMDRIKIAYLNLKQHIRIENLNKINCQVFALHDNFQRYGFINYGFEHRLVDQRVKGGINGVNLLDSWNPLTPWTVDFVTVRNYFGEDTAYQVYLKTHLILYFIVITPLGIIGQIVTRLFIYYNTHYTQYMQRGFSSTHKQELIFHIAFFALTIGIFSFFLSRWQNKEQSFKDNFVENETQSTFRYSYKGPYIRNNVTDSVNEHSLTVDLKSLIIKALGFLLILVVLGGECGFFHGMRMAIIQLTKVIPRTSIYLISWSHIICYGFYFIFNFIFYRYIIRNVTELLTRLQNIPTQDMHRDSRNSKNSLFLIGIELIPVIFLLIFEPLKGTSCYSSSCYDEFTQYIYSRYVIVFIFLGVKLLLFVYLYIDTKRKSVNNEKNSFVRNFDEKLLQYIRFVKSESLQPQYELSIQEETEALLHYGIFLTSFPLSPLLGLANLILQYLIERIEVIVRNRRPIPKSQIIEFYSDNYKLVMHLSIFVNSWLIFFTLEEVEYSFGRLIRFFATNSPTYEGILVLKIVVIILSIIVFEIYISIIRYFASETESKMLNNRKKRKYDKHIIHGNVLQKNKPNLEMHKIHPFRTIFRTYHKQIIQQSKKGPVLTQELSQGSQDQASAQYLKAKKG